MTRREMEEAVLAECEYRVRRMSSGDLESELAAMRNGLRIELTATAGTEEWLCSSCRMESIDCDCNPFGSEQCG